MSKNLALILTGFLGGGLIQSRGITAPTLYYYIVFGTLAVLTIIAALIWGKP